MVRLMNVCARFRLNVRPNLGLRFTSLLTHRYISFPLGRVFCTSRFLFISNNASSMKSGKPHDAELKQPERDRGIIADPERTYLEEILIQKESEPKTMGQKVKRAAETTFYISFGLVSCVVLGVLTYFAFKEFFAFNTPQGLYRDVAKRVKSDERCRDMFGSRVMAFGEESGRGRRRHIPHNRYIKDGQERLSIMFHVKGEIATGKVVAEIFKENDGNWAYRFILVETDWFPKKSIFLIDNRNE